MPSHSSALRRAVLLALLAAGRVAAQDGTAPASEAEAQARAFRERVAQLARIYGESSGIDPAGARVEARRLRELPDGCARVE